MTDSKLAPIALFVYARPQHTLSTLQALMASDLASQSTLYIFADGAKPNASEQTLEGIRATRQLLRSQQWCGEVIIRESTENKGIGDNVTAGVTEICNKHGKVIVLEDDLEVSKGFLRYMNDALTVYENDEKVMHIAGYMYPVASKLPETFLLTAMYCWGWATWQRAWQHFNNDASYLYGQMEHLHFPSDFDIHPTNGHLSLLKGNVDATAPYNWDINWTTSIYLKKGLCLVPGKSLVRNIGHDGTGLHCGYNEHFQHQAIADYIKVERIEPMIQSRKGHSIMYNYYARQQYNLKNRLLRRAYNLMGKPY